MPLPSWGRLIPDGLGKGLRRHKPIFEFCQHKLAIASQELFRRYLIPIPRQIIDYKGTYRAARVSIVHGGADLATVQQME